MSRFALAAVFLLFAGCDQSRPSTGESLVRAVGSATLDGTPDAFTTTATTPEGALVTRLAEGTTMAHLYFDELRLQPGQPFAARLIGSDGQPRATLTSYGLADEVEVVAFQLGDLDVEEVSTLFIGTDGSTTGRLLDVELCRSSAGCPVASVRDEPDSYLYRRTCDSEGNCEILIVVDYHQDAAGTQVRELPGEASVPTDKGVRELGVVLKTRASVAPDVVASRLSGYESLRVYKTDRR